MSFRRRLKYSLLAVSKRISHFHLPGWLSSSLARAAAVSLVVLLGGAYIFVTNAAATSGYEIQRLEKQIETESNELRRLETETAEAQSMGSIQKRLPELPLVATVKVKRLLLVNDLVVAKR